MPSCSWSCSSASSFPPCWTTLPAAAAAGAPLEDSWLIEVVHDPLANGVGARTTLFCSLGQMLPVACSRAVVRAWLPVACSPAAAAAALLLQLVCDAAAPTPSATA